MTLVATAYLGAIGFSVMGLVREPPLKTYVIVPDEDWTRCVEIRATSERLARREVARRPIPAAGADECAILPAVNAVDPRLMVQRGFNASLVVSAILAALWGAGAAARAWRNDAASPL